MFTQGMLSVFKKPVTPVEFLFPSKAIKAYVFALVKTYCSKQWLSKLLAFTLKVMLTCLLGIFYINSSSQSAQDSWNPNKQGWWPFITCKHKANSIKYSTNSLTIAPVFWAQERIWEQADGWGAHIKIQSQETDQCRNANWDFIYCSLSEM